ncbi:NADPH:quinone oxidoreductase family protein [Yoonia sediminilitoris]|uniref:NADPH2:quinone reductase n=1 Tax=Yoonia sediminilitoris TaxID=1286148 RepID=A0A2T6KQ18_9RHOB|nr:NADPH:quinone oxidoreductase family protein [Yoonia sediminilitoris]PUB18650.1 NADPH2:quinone reductase [Yoonia sediminilitoris]RCW98818.1 NADPH2:quinone reductase [Yoonia sediminilitoris]
MRAFQVSSFDNAPALTNVPTPVVKKNEILLKVDACGLNFADLLMATGTYQETPTPPFTLGMEVCGTVIGQGADVTEPALGSRVAVFGGSGGLAEQGVFPAAMCRPVPDQMPSHVAAGFMVAYGTSHLALTRRANLAAGETLLVLGAAGGVGLTAVEIGKALGATVIAVARGADKLAVAKAAGADHLIDSTTDDIKAAVKALGGADVVYDPVGGDAFKAAIGACKPEARVLVIGFASGAVPPIAANILLVKNITVMGFYWGGYLKFNPTALTDSLSELMALYTDGKLSPHISHILPLDQAADAMELLRSRKSTGKVVVTPQPA